MTTEKQVNTALESEKAALVIRDLVSKAPALKLVERESKTGFSYFAGKKRLCKLLKTKKGVRLELNVTLPKKFSDMPEVDNISLAQARDKHLGTMKHLYRGSDTRHIKSIMAEALKVFKVEAATEHKTIEAKEEVKEEIKAEIKEA